MKRYSIVFSLVAILFMLLSLTAKAETSLSDIYISVTDAKSAIQDKDEKAFDKHFKEIKDNWQSTNKKDHKLVEKIDQDIEKVEKTTSQKDRESALNTLTSDLIDYEKVLNPVDKQKKRDQLQNEMQPLIKNITKAISDKDFEKAKTINNQLNATWTKNEKIVREEDIGRYGQVETALMFTRIELTKDKVDANSAQMQVDQLKKELDDYHAGKKSDAKTSDQDVNILNEHLDTAIKNIKNNDLAKSKQALQQFIIAWPNVESEISTRNGALYTKIEQKIPQYAGQLDEDNKEDIGSQLETLNQEIKSTISKTSYTFWDAALILLREGVEALLIIMALLTVTRKSEQTKASKWIITGSVIGIVLSIALAFIFKAIFENLGSTRELTEGLVGIGSVILMIIVGIWLHSKSSLDSWQNFINKNMDKAMSTGSIVTFGLVAFLSVFREGAETIIFYLGIVGKISTWSLILGIIVASVILALIAIFFNQITKWIPIHRLFFIMSLFIFILAFKILGVSIHTLQILNIIPQHTINHLPFIDLIGFYPTYETLIPQLALVILVVIYYAMSKKK
ncbi:FTR1 family iron permease [Mammaliicoccus sciuri]|uniref:FTR1 family iron permease n=1 Tax=Mammaliicoccus sciuri TaxID=1296 RepID=UPI00066D067D|nr:FTR1 family protein [Mammaliicoccus sciuri]MCJ0908255.1 FTR1 family protein [Mammaliicoccus sciuri]MCJ0921864.1 FTR1 family protein [Mammaliicoccus sciuri]MCJ0924551.1 FTR1 family protein [Mammaliicoccus sciuri]MEB6119123.1 FTR1 family protein [Mammaliicoccus sciuri]MEB6286979.1 FTR1 family protein [Mammaliicoccus sciuri]